MIHSIQATFAQEITFFDNQCDKVGSFLDKNPTLYKSVLVASHIFRSASMFGIMKYTNLPLPISFGLMTLPSLLYRSSIERFCIFRFTLPSLAGGVSIWAARNSAIAIIAGTALSSLSSIFLTSLGILCLTGYLVFICELSHSDIEKYMQNLQKKEKKPCCL